MSELEKVTALCAHLGAPPEQAAVMAGQLLKRAGQISVERKISREEALVQLLGILVDGRQGNVPEAYRHPDGTPPAT